MSTNQKNNHIQTELGVQAAPTRTLMNQTLGQTFAESGSSYNFRARSLYGNRTNLGSSSKAPLSLLIKRDELKENKRKRELAIESHKKSMELQYKSFI